MSDYRIDAASKEEWAVRADRAEAEITRLRAELSAAKECIANLEESEERLEAELAAMQELIGGKDKKHLDNLKTLCTNQHSQ